MSDHVIVGRPTPVHDPGWQLDRIVDELRAARADQRARNGHTEVTGRELPSCEAVRQILEALRGTLFPMWLGPTDLREESEDFYVGHTLDSALNALIAQVRLELRHTVRQARAVDRDPDAEAVRLARDFVAALPILRCLLDTDVLAAYHGDSAARSADEVLLCYPGIPVVIHHRIAHHLYRIGLPLLAHMVAKTAHADAGIDIHLDVQIGNGFFTDHGAGVMIGETVVIDECVRIYQAVTLGAKRFSTDTGGHLERGVARHSVVEDGVVIHADATTLGCITIGRGSPIGGSAWPTCSVPPGNSVTQANVQSGVQEGVQSPRLHMHNRSEAHPMC